MRVECEDGVVSVFEVSSTDLFGKVIGKVRTGDMGLVVGRTCDRLMDARYGYYNVFFSDLEIIGMVFSGFLVAVATE